jgi:hypothetical protein
MGQGERIQTLHYEPRRMYSNSSLWAKENVFKLFIMSQGECIQTLHYEPRRMYSNSSLWAKEKVFKH